MHEAGSLRVRCPGAPAEELEAVIINTAGGIAGGDRFALDIAAGQGTRLVVTTAAAEKVYRTLGPDSVIDVKLDVARGRCARLAAAGNDPVRSRAATRSIEVDLAPDARLFLAEAIVFGRSGMGEAVEEGAFSTAGACGAAASSSMRKACGSMGRLRNGSPRPLSPRAASRSQRS